MTFKELLKNKWFKVFSSIYVLVLTIFAVWMLFFDTNSILFHHELNQEIKKLEKQKEHLQKEIESDKKVIKKLNEAGGLEKFAREEYYLKKENEDIYIIEDEDSLKIKENE
ncbi:FtsB family cell division protein [Ascidiimonas sp. W6]|uniref:FtsB family cell division protein n=1 Tax=Ascidiimonas meishanensis TaxID=3128903 RepID=UPI0030EF2611